MTPVLAVLGVLAVGPVAAAYIPYSEVAPILAALSAEAIPEPLRAADPEARRTLWLDWAASRDREIRGRLAQGAEDSTAHLMLFGTSFTREARATIEDLGRLSASEGASDLAARLRSRIHDLAQALAKPGVNERLDFVRGLVVGKGLDPATPEGQGALEQYLYDNLKRVLHEDADYAAAIAAARHTGDPSSEFARRSSLFRARGLSSDTSLLPNLALEESLAELKSKGLLAPGSVRRVAVAGPGLDFTDKRDGYDFYPQQTLQPFAIMDSLLRLGLARPAELRVSTYDLSPQVNDHLTRATVAAAAGRGYVVQLPRDEATQWKPAAVRYWLGFGDTIGTSASPVPVPPGVGEVKTRAVRIRPDVVKRVDVHDVNIVLQRPILGPGEAFDLVVATNVLVYYDVFEQSLALANMASVLKPGGFLLSNNAVLELPGSAMRSVGYKTTVYSDREADGDHIVWYRKLIVD